MLSVITRDRIAIRWITQHLASPIATRDCLMTLYLVEINLSRPRFCDTFQILRIQKNTNGTPFRARSTNAGRRTQDTYWRLLEFFSRPEKNFEVSTRQVGERMPYNATVCCITDQVLSFCVQIAYAYRRYNRGHRSPVDEQTFKDRQYRAQFANSSESEVNHLQLCLRAPITHDLWCTDRSIKCFIQAV